MGCVRTQTRSSARLFTTSCQHLTDTVSASWEAPLNILSESELALLPSTHPLQRTRADGGVLDAPVLQRYRGRGEQVADAPPSVWFMRQAGRSLPEYRKAREGVSMLEACVRPELAAEITVQPVRRHGVDAAIFFSDIVVPVMLAGIDVEIRPGVGPVFTRPIRTEADVDALPELGDGFEEALAPIRDAVRLTVGELGTTPLMGFAGAPFTVASYMVEGGPSRDHLRTRALMRESPEVWARLARWVAEASGRFLRAQVLAGASGVQLFDSWVGALSNDQYRRHVRSHSSRVFEQVQDLPVPRVHFGVGAAHLLAPMHRAGATVMGIDHRLSLAEAIASLPEGTPVQGNIDPAVLFTGPEQREQEALQVLAAGAAAPGHVVNLGHGVPPDADPQVITDLVAFLHAQPAGGPAEESDAERTAR